MSTNNTLPTSNNPNKALDKEKADARKTHKILKQLHFCGTFTVKTIASALLITVLLWLFARPPDPQVHVTAFSIEALNKTITPLPLPTIMNYNFTIHNSDLYKSLNYIVLVLRISYSEGDSADGATVDFNEGKKGLTQRPGKTDILPNHTLNYNYTDLGYASNEFNDFMELKNTTTSMYLRFVMEARVMVFGRIVASRQMMKSANLYFDQNGHAIITPPGGLALR